MKRSKHLILEFKDQILKLYHSGKSLRDIERILNIGRRPISCFLKSENILIRNKSDQARIFEVDHNYFSDIDSEDKAYFLGLLLADGYNNTDSGTIALGLNDKDEDIIKEFAKCTKSTYPIRDIKPYGQSKPGKRIQINSRKMSEDLAKLGVLKNKTYLAKYTPDLIKDEYIKHFIRGVFDGDGCICSAGAGYRFYICGCEALVVPLASIIHQKTGILMRKFPNSKQYKHPTFCIYGTSGVNQVYYVMKWLYSDAKYFLKRKNEKFQDLVMKIKNRQHKNSYDWIHADGPRRLQLASL